MSSVAMTLNDFKELCETTDKTFRCLDPKYINSDYVVAHFQRWADVANVNPPFLNIYQEIDSSERNNYSIMYHDTFVTGNVFVIYDKYVAENSAILLTSYTPPQSKESQVV